MSLMDIAAGLYIIDKVFGSKQQDACTSASYGHGGGYEGNGATYILLGLLGFVVVSVLHFNTSLSVDSIVFIFTWLLSLFVLSIPLWKH